MISITKIFRFEAAYALHGYRGACANIHGHSYNLHVRVASVTQDHGYVGGTGIIYDFRDLKEVVHQAVICHFDHQLILSEKYMAMHPNIHPNGNVYVMDAEPTVENLLLLCRIEIAKVLPATIRLVSIRLAETRDSYAEWSAG